MFDLDAAVRRWRDELAGHRSLSAADLDELEDHVRCAYDSLVGRGVEAAEAWALAREGIGAPADLSAEFRRADGVVWRRLLGVGWAMFALSFFLPVHRYGDTLFHVSLGDGLLPGIQALLVALQGGVYGIASALTNALMLLTAWKVSDRGRAQVAALAWATTAAFLLNAAWLWSFDTFLVDLRVGYFAWWTSFGVVAAALTLRAHALTPAADPVASS